jgi:hypothetical protein
MKKPRAVGVEGCPTSNQVADVILKGLNGQECDIDKIRNLVIDKLAFADDKKRNKTISNALYVMKTKGQVTYNNNIYSVKGGN